MADELRGVVDVDRVLHEPARLLLVALLYPVEDADFLFLLRESGLTRGNLSSHIAKLEEGGYVAVTKGYQGRVPHTDYRLTDEGRAAFRAYREQMKRTLRKLPR
jgi:DNA-binding MarR family transcriptional regulator